MANSATLNASSSGTRGRSDTQPPSKLPSPSPTMKLLTTMAALSTLLPNTVSSVRCQHN